MCAHDVAAYGGGEGRVEETADEIDLDGSPQREASASGSEEQNPPERKNTPRCEQCRKRRQKPQDVDSSEGRAEFLEVDVQEEKREQTNADDGSQDVLDQTPPERLLGR